MTLEQIRGGIAVSVTAALVLACGCWTTRSAPVAKNAPATQPKEASTDWRFYGGDAASSKYAPLTQITRENAKSLAVAWVWDSPDEEIVRRINNQGVKIWPHAYETSPLVVNGVLYASTSLSQVAAVDALTGRTLWTYDPKSYVGKDGAVVSPPNVGFIARGIAYWENGKDKRIFFGTVNSKLIALDLSGKPVAGFGDGGSVDLRASLRRPVPPPFYSVVSPPMVCNDTVVVGSSVLDFPLTPQMPPGDVRGFDATTGKLLWTFHTVAQPGEVGNDTWKEDSWKDTGAANVWPPMSCDPQLGIVYMPVSTPANDYFGGLRKGDGLFGDSVVAVNAKTGERVWHFQITHHGLWDYDPPAAPNLVDITVDGRAVKALVQVTKQGLVFVLDRVTGKPVWPIEERPVPQSTVPGEETAPTQPFPMKPAPVDRVGLTNNDLVDFTPELRSEALDLVRQFEYGPIYTPPSVDSSATGGKKGTIYLPGNLGGSSWTGAAFHPEKRVLYVPTVTRPAVASLRPFKSAGFVGTTYPLTLPNGLPITKPPYGRLTAIDLDTGNHLWMTPIGRGPVDHPALKELKLSNLGWSRRSFALATKDLLFVVQEGNVQPRKEQLGRTTTLFEVENSDAFLWAYDLDRGTMISETPIVAGNASGAPITYMANGRQFIVVPVGGGGLPARLVAFALPNARPN
jgi:quinoprotein glucose dehydrogenase